MDKLLGSELERLKEALLLQLRELRWDVVDFDTTTVTDTDGVVELRLRISSKMWNERKSEANDERRAEEEISKIQEIEQKQQQIAAEVNPPENVILTTGETTANETAEEERRLRRLWLEFKEQARQKVFKEVQREQNERILAVRDLRHKLGMDVRGAKNFSNATKTSALKTDYADDPFPDQVPLSPRVDNPLGSPILPAATSSTLRAVSLGTQLPTTSWHAELRPGMVFEVEAKLENGFDQSEPNEEWWVGRKFGDQTGPKKAIPSRYLHVLSGHPAFLPQQSLQQLLQSENLASEASSRVDPTANRNDKQQPELPARATIPSSVEPALTPVTPSTVQQPSLNAGEEPKNSDEHIPQVRPAPLPSPEEKKAPPGSSSSASLSKIPSYAMMPIPVISNEIAAAIKDRERRKQDSGIALAPLEKDRVEPERRRAATSTATIGLPRPSQPPADNVPSSAGALLRPLPPSRIARRSLDPSSASCSALPSAPDRVEEEAPPPLPPMPATLPPSVPPSVSSGSFPSTAAPAGLQPTAASPLRARPVSMPPSMLAKLMAEEAGLSGPPPALPPLPSGIPPQQPTTAQAPALAALPARQVPVLERKRSATVVGEVDRSPTSSPTLPGHATLRRSRKSKGPEDLINSAEKKKEDKKKKKEEKEKKRKEKEKKKEEKKKKKDKSPAS